MSRLIDADALIVLAENTFARPNGFIQLIEETETAFDVEKVLEQLEEESDFFGGEPMGSLQKAYYCKGVENAIDIVKRGGIE